jgi:hypothetical protein
MRHAIALILTLATTSVTSYVLYILSFGALLGLAAMALIGSALGSFCLYIRSPLTRVCFAFPFTGLLGLGVLWLRERPERLSQPIHLFEALSLPLVAAYFVHTGYLGAIGRKSDDNKDTGKAVIGREP